MVIWTYLPARTVTVYRTHATTHPAFFETIFVVITEYSFLSDSIPERQNQWTQWGHHCDSLRVHPPPEVYAAFWLWVVLVSTANNYQVFCIPKQTIPLPKFMLLSDYELSWLVLRIIIKYFVFRNKRNCIQRRHVTTWLSLLADRVMFLLQITSLCLHTESSICHRSEAIWNSSALMTPFFPAKRRRDRLLNKSLFNNLFTIVL